MCCQRASAIVIMSCRVLSCVSIFAECTTPAVSDLTGIVESANLATVDALERLPDRNPLNSTAAFPI